MLTIDKRKYDLQLAKNHLTTTEVADRMNVSRQRLALILNQKNVSPKVIGRLYLALPGREGAYRVTKKILEFNN